MIVRKAFPIPLLLLSLCCADQEHASPPAGASDTADTESTGAAPIEPLSSQAASPSAPSVPSGGSAVQGAGIGFEIPEGWEEQAPSSGMRLAQAAIPGPGGPALMVVFYFGEGGGGGVEANLQRWIGQMEVAPGTEPRRETFEANGLQVTLLDVSGTQQPDQMGMGGPTEPQPGARLLAAVVEGPGGPWFFKATGPDSTLAPQRDAFVSMLRSLRAGA